MWQKTLGGDGDDGLNSVVQTADGGYFLSGGTDSLISGDIIQNPKGIYDYWIMKLDADDLSISDNEINSYVIVYPNPASTDLNIKASTSINNIKSITIYNILGQNVISMSNTENVLIIDISILETGTYFVKMETNIGIANVKFIKN